MNACVEIIPSQLPVTPVPQLESARHLCPPVPGGDPAKFAEPQQPQAATAEKRSWFSASWLGTRKSRSKESLLGALPVGNLHGVGHTHARTLVERGVTTVGQLRRIPKPVLVAAFGKAIGKHIWESARDLDAQTEPPPSTAKSISPQPNPDSSALETELAASLLAYLHQRIGHTLRKQANPPRTIHVHLRFVDHC